MPDRDTQLRIEQMKADGRFDERLYEKLQIAAQKSGIVAGDKTAMMNVVKREFDVVLLRSL